VTRLLILAVLALAGCAPESKAQEGLLSNRPQGFFGEGHAANHEHYLGLRNANNGSCCNGADCRPTQAKWDVERSTWQVMVDGEWRVIDPMFSAIILTPQVLEKQGRVRWDAQAHVCTNLSGSTVYCLLPPASGG